MNKDGSNNNNFGTYKDYLLKSSAYKNLMDTYKSSQNGSWVDDCSYTTGSSVGSLGDVTTTTGTTGSTYTNSYGAHTHTISTVDYSNMFNHSFDANTFIKTPFSKSSFLDSLSEGKSVVNAISSLIDSLTDDGVIDAIEFVDKIGCLTDDVYWQMANKKHSVYIMYTRFHDVDNCKAFFSNSKNHNLIKFTREDILENAEFKRHINTMKLKGMF